MAAFLVSCAPGPAPVGPVATAQATPAPSEIVKPIETKTSFETFIASFDISAEKYTTTQAITAAYYERYNNWINAGLTVENKDTQMVSDAAIMIHDVEAKFDSGITSRLFTTSKTAKSLITSIDELRSGTIANYQMSWSRGDAVPYVSNDELLSVKLASSDNPDLTKATAFGVHAHSRHGQPRQEYIPYFIEHHQVGKLDITRNDDINFVRDVATNTWKVDSSYLINSVDRSK